MTISRREFLAGAGVAAAAAGAGVAAAAGAGVLLPGVASASTGITRVRERGLAPATLTMWTNHPEWVQQVNALVGEFEKQYPSVTVQVTPKPGPATRRC